MAVAVLGAAAAISLAVPAIDGGTMRRAVPPLTAPPPGMTTLAPPGPGTTSLGAGAKSRVPAGAAAVPTMPPPPTVLEVTKNRVPPPVPAAAMLIVGATAAGVATPPPMLLLLLLLLVSEELRLADDTEMRFCLAGLRLMVPPEPIVMPLLRVMPLVVSVMPVGRGMPPLEELRLTPLLPSPLVVVRVKPLTAAAAATEWPPGGGGFTAAEERLSPLDFIGEVVVRFCKKLLLFV